MEISKISSGFWVRTKSWVAVISILGLGVLNVATLINHEVHETAYNVLRGLIGHFSSDSAAKILARSPTSVQQGLVAKINAQKIKIDAQRLKVHAISHRMVPRIGKVAVRSLSTLPVRITPILGTAASIGLTAWELVELCHMMQDLDELSLFFDSQVGDVGKVCGLKVPFTIPPGPSIN